MLVVDAVEVRSMVGCVRTVPYSASMSGGRSIAVMAEDRNQANVEGEGFASRETDDFEAMPSGPQSEPTE